MKSKEEYAGSYACKKMYRCTPHQYQVSVRIRHARRLLSAGLPVAGVCAEIGFESLFSFTNLFKRMTGVSPAAYQSSRRTLAAGIAADPLRFVPCCFAAAAGWTS